MGQLDSNVQSPTAVEVLSGDCRRDDGGAAVCGRGMREVTPRAPAK
jgi:hypothetical protein